MKIRVMFLMVCIMAITPAVFPQTTINLFNPVSIHESPFGFGPSGIFNFATKQVYLNCAVGSVGTLSGPDNGNLIVDDYLLVNGDNTCPNNESCFDGLIVDPLPNLGQSAQFAYGSVPPIDISGHLSPGNRSYTFTLVDIVYTYASSEINLSTTCAQVYPVCHHDSGRRGMKTIFVGSLDAVIAHLSNHDGDTEGPCGN
jgi:hypothetical protein